MLSEILADPRVVYLKGNHDDMFVEGVLEGDSELFSHWVENCGGRSTYEAWKADGSPLDILKKLRHAPLSFSLMTQKGFILLSHAGCTPWKKPLSTLSKMDLLWDREHFYDPWTLGDTDVFVVHGHTPVGSAVYCPQAVKPEFYCEGHKVNIDLGTYLSCACALLNLDDFGYEIIRV